MRLGNKIKMNIKISIIIVVKNAKETIERSIKSVLCQSNTNFQLIIIDGQSTDGTLDIIEKYRNNIDVFISEKDNGIYYAMNKGIYYSNGDVLAFLNSDDWYCEDTLERVKEVFENNNYIEMVYGDVLLENELVTSKRIADDNFLNTLLNFNICHQCVFVRKEIFEKIGIFNTVYRYAAEYDWMLRVALSGVHMFHDNMFYVHYSTGGMSEQHVEEHSTEAWKSSKKWLCDKELLKIAEKRYKKNIAKSHWQNTLRTMDECALDIIKNCLKQKKFDSNIIIYGAGRFGRELKILLDTISINTVAFLDKKYQEIKNIEEISVISFESYIKNYKKNKVIITPINAYEDIEEVFKKNNLLKDKDYLILIEFLIEVFSFSDCNCEIKNNESITLVDVK